ncbi:MAG: hypothetical protein A2270_00585 [Elusimicrobia bacterium RIFOXYA12_FULL_51_18]|nr:MAG: hypothetical protein A2270_00585 [Elusimicrobia bacterium RIFOXYA12_FULL_51_18]OGS28994.1 MAG: hypothetical protein A2218_08600 [Elusimicrobia bacterium RIFOXYA2_FULL_53_38]
MLHEPAAQSGPDASADYKMQIGVWMFLLYAVVYAVFVAINLLKPLWMEKIIFSGLNLAVVYGFGLIAFALVLALIYNHMCGLHEADSKDAEGGK